MFIIFSDNEMCLLLQYTNDKITCKNRCLHCVDCYQCYNDKQSLTYEVQFRVHTVWKKCANFETVQLEIVRIDFDDIWLKCSKDSRIEFACFSFRVSTFRFILHTENNANFDTVSSKHAKHVNFNKVQFFKNIYLSS